jgi:uncharacterized SAM-binding protein YcdF (DUF218 family)
MKVRSAVTWGIATIVGALFFFGLVLTRLLESTSYGLPFQRAVLLFLPALQSWHTPYTLRSGEKIAGLIVLGGHISRIEATQELLLSYADTRVLLTGPGDLEIQLVKKLPIQPGRIVIYPGPLNTYKEAVLIRRYLDIAPEETWLLVTSAFHMPRALATFHAQCLRVFPWPVRDSLPEPRYMAPAIYREIVGLISYALLGRFLALAQGAGSCANSSASGQP